MAWGGPIPINQGFPTYEVPDRAHRSQTDSGPGKSRPRPDPPNERYGLTQLHDATQYAALLNYYTNTLEHGTQTFTETHPIYHTTRTFRFASGLTLQHAGANYWQVSFVLEVLP
ncbi:MAG: hypothetical protein NPIRA02_29510 [Nitrospirales bacterium]|nr:MAG: hypothetical protein NPIRA02_29510 [Nitrospirales bacterium]